MTAVEDQPQITTAKRVRGKKSAEQVTEELSPGIPSKHVDVVFPDRQLKWVDERKDPMSATSNGEVIRRTVADVEHLDSYRKIAPNAIVIIYDPDRDNEVLAKNRLDKLIG